ncbi:MAG: serine/threonine-protein kinase [Bradymonadia bacterium]
MLGRTQPPDHVGQYALGKRLGVGSMGIVHLAVHESLGRQAALKLRFKENHPSEELLSERFFQGAVLQAELNHQAIAQIHDYFETDTYQAIAIEYLAGGSLEDQLKATGRPIDVIDVVGTGLTLAAALRVAHAQGVVHRDIKPANILFARAGVPQTAKLCDFGVAKAPERSPDLTVVGANVGTIWYMPPEQFAKAELDGRADIYALGATLYEMLTGTIPFERVDTGEVFKRFLDGAPLPPIRSRNPMVPPALAAVVEACLTVDASQRMPSAVALYACLEAVLVTAGLALPSDRTDSEHSVLASDAFTAVLDQIDSDGSVGLVQALTDLGYRNDAATIGFKAYDASQDDAEPITALGSGGFKVIETVEQSRFDFGANEEAFDDDDDDHTIVTFAEDDEFK